MTEDPKPTTEPKFKVGDKLRFINDAGIDWGLKEVTEVEWGGHRGWTYHVTPTDTPWCPLSERNLHVPAEPPKEWGTW